MNHAYAAGLFDADGWVRAVNPNKTSRWHVEVGVSNCYLPVLKRLMAKYGGGVYRSGGPSLLWRNRYQWVASSATARDFLVAVEPFCVVKKEQVRLAIRLCRSVEKWRYKLGNQYRKHPKRDAIMAYRADLARKIKELKHEKFDL